LHQSSGPQKLQNILSPKKITVAQHEKQQVREHEFRVDRNVDVLVIGGGPSSLGLCINALKNNKFNELVENDGLAILESGTSFGGGNLG
jgi:ribulose 1,5-bisphosphate synthetase/thiazole synthase